MTRTLVWLACVGLVGCGASTSVVEEPVSVRAPDTPPRDEPPEDPAPTTEALAEDNVAPLGPPPSSTDPNRPVMRFGDDVELGGERVGLHSYQLGTDTQPAMIELVDPSDPDAPPSRIVEGGCRQVGSVVASLRSILPHGDDAYVELVLRPVAPARRLADGAETVVSLGQTLRATSGDTLRVAAVQPRDDLDPLALVERRAAGIDPSVDRREMTINRDGRDEEYGESFDNDRYFTAYATDQSDAIGCPMLRVRTEAPLQAAVLRPRTVTIARGRSIRVGYDRLRYLGAGRLLVGMPGTFVIAAVGETHSVSGLSFEVVRVTPHAVRVRAEPIGHHGHSTRPPRRVE